jgi:hypothetical protein
LNFSVLRMAVHDRRAHRHLPRRLRAPVNANDLTW